MKAPLFALVLNEYARQVKVGTTLQRKAAVQELGAQASPSAASIAALESAATEDPEPEVREAAKQVLIRLGHVPCGASQSPPPTVHRPRKWPGRLIIAQILYALSLGPWLASIGVFVFYCNPADRCYSLSGQLWYVYLWRYPLFVFIACIAAWILHGIGLKRAAVWANLIPLALAIGYVLAYLYFWFSYNHS